MIRLFLAAGVSAAALVLAMPAAAQDEAAAAPAMEFGSWGVDPASLDSAVRPGDDFFAYVNGKWVRDNPLPPEFTRYGAFDALSEKSTADIKTLVDELIAANPAPGTSERRIVDAYNAYLDTAAIDAAGLAPAQPWLDRIRGAGNLADLAEL